MSFKLQTKNFRQKGDRDKHVKARHPNAPVPSPKQKVKFPTFGRGRTKNIPSSKPDKKPAKKPDKKRLRKEVILGT